MRRDSTEPSQGAAQALSSWISLYRACDRIPDSFNGAKAVYLLPNTICPTGGTPVAQYQAHTAKITPVGLLLASSLLALALGSK